MTLPIDDILPELQSALTRHQTVVLQAPPGAGKTTRVPLVLLDETWLQGQKILMLEPRRLAATNAAHYMASQHGETIGATVGYTIRYQRKTSQRTRLEVVTEGILARRLQADPELQGVGLVIFDEFHERNLNSDLALALCRDAQQALREDLKILVMSATLDGEPLANLLNAPLLTSQGRSFPVDIRYCTQQAPDIVEATAATVRRALRETDGDLLVFLPGAGEINRCRTLLQGARDIDIRPLYAALPYSAQEKAITPGHRRKVVLATNIAETSLTIDGIRVVIDSGYARQPRFDPGTGLTRLEAMRISQASATQRTGRAGRVAPGICYRLWSEGVQGGLLPFTPPEIRNADLAPLALHLANWGVSDPLQLTWIDPPPEGALAAGRELLQNLGALDEAQQLTGLGRQMAKQPTHPRLARLLCMAQQLNCLPLACDLVALLENQAPRRSASDVVANGTDTLQRRIELLRTERRQGTPGDYLTIERAADDWKRRFRIRPGTSVPVADESLVGKLLAAAFPDRIGRQRENGSRRYRFVTGQGGLLPEHSIHHTRPFLIASELIGKKTGDGTIRQAWPLDLEDLLELYPDLKWTKQVFWDSQAGRICGRDVKLLGRLVITERQKPVSDGESLPVLLDVIRREGLDLLNWSQEAETFRARVATVSTCLPEEDWPEVSTLKLQENMDNWLSPFLNGVRNKSDLKRVDLLSALRSLFDWRQLRRLDALAPERIQVASGSHIRLQYFMDDPPILAVKLQEMFGEADTPRICEKKIVVRLHLLSPAGRPLQVTQDLRHFWDTVYPDVKKEMKGRYPKHPWPDDPWYATPTRHTKKRGRRDP